MRFEKGHREATRRRIIEIASEKFRKDGIEAVGIAGLMGEAGLTHGGFYAHFDSKEALVREALDAAFDGSRLKYSDGLEALLRNYLRPAHRDHPERGCAIAALAPEVARHPAETRAAFSLGIERFIEKIADLLPETARGRPVAIGIASVLIGALQMARTVTDAKLSSQILESGIAAALALART